MRSSGRSRCSTPRRTSAATSTRSPSSARRSPLRAGSRVPEPERPRNAVPGAARMHSYSAETEALARAIADRSVRRIRERPPLDGPRSVEELQAAAGRTIIPKGVGWREALRVFDEELAPACISVDHPLFAAFVPCAPTDASVLFDLFVGASSL